VREKIKEKIFVKAFFRGNIAFFTKDRNVSFVLGDYAEMGLQAEKRDFRCFPTSRRVEVYFIR